MFHFRIYLQYIFHLFHTQKTKRKVSYWYGGRSKKELFYLDHFKKIEKDFKNFNFYVGLSEPLPEDNWSKKEKLEDKKDGYEGFIHQVLYDNYLSKHKEPEDVEYYLCGPPLMNQAVLKMLEDMGVPDENIRFDDFRPLKSLQVRVTKALVINMSIRFKNNIDSIDTRG